MGKKKIEEEEDYEEEEEEESEEEDREIKRAKEEEDDYLMRKESEEEQKDEDIEMSKQENKKKETEPESNPNTKTKAIKQKKSSEKTIGILDTSYNIDDSYFYQPLSKKDLDNIKSFISSYLYSTESNPIQLDEFFSKYPKIIKGNSNQLLQIINNSNPQNIIPYASLVNYIINKYYTPKPSVLECYFFPNIKNELYVVNMLRTCKKTLDIAIFTLTNDKICAAIEEAYSRGVRVRVIADDECCNMWGSDVSILAARGIPCKTDNSVKYHMHHKFAILDNSVVLTGSFNWTSQAVKYNQENILFYENKEIAQKYTVAFEELWNMFNNVLE